MKKNQTYNLVLSALFLAIAYILPFVTGQIPEIGSMLCPMHIPVLICGFICGWRYGMATGFIAPLLRSLTLGMPPLFPTAVCMAFELACYGAVSDIMYKLLPQKKYFLYIALVIAMISGRIIWGTAMFLCISLKGSVFTFSAFISGAITNAIPGIIVQLIIVPIAVILLDRYKNKREQL